MVSDISRLSSRGFPPLAHVLPYCLMGATQPSLHRDQTLGLALERYVCQATGGLPKKNETVDLKNSSTKLVKTQAKSLHFKSKLCNRD